MLVSALPLLARLAVAQGADASGHSIGRVSTREGFIVVNVTPGVLEPEHLFDLTGKTVRFRPEGPRYRVDVEPLHWDPEFGTALKAPDVTFDKFSFPFSGKRWSSLFIGLSGSIRFGIPGKNITPDPYGRLDPGVTLDRFDALADAANALVDSVEAICVFLKPRLTGTRYVKQLDGRVVITWDLTEPFGGILDFHWFATRNLFQVELYSSGEIAMSYKTISARDGIVGLYTHASPGETVLLDKDVAMHAELPTALDPRRVTVSAVDSELIRVRLFMRSDVPHEGDAIDGTEFRIDFAGANQSRHLSWSVRGQRDPYNPANGGAQFVASGAGLTPRVRVNADTIQLEGVLVPSLRGLSQARLTLSVTTKPNGSRVNRWSAGVVDLSALQSPAVDFSARRDAQHTYSTIYEAFHYSSTPRPQDLACSVIGALGDRFDFLVYYSDFRIDSQEASSPSFGPAAGNVSGIGQDAHDLGEYCSRGRFQWALAQPVFTDANEMWPAPPTNAPATSDRDIGYYYAHRSSLIGRGAPSPYNYAMSHLGHEFAHRWGAYVSALVDGDTIPLGPWPHWDPGLQTSVAFPYQMPAEASTLGGAVWRDNHDGTFTRLRDGYFVPATSYSPLDLYLMGYFAPAEVPDFFLLRDLARVGSDSSGHAVFRARRTNISIRDVIAANGERVPDAAHAQHRFNTGFVLVVRDGREPSTALLRRAAGIREQWIHYWGAATGNRGVMDANLR